MVRYGFGRVPLLSVGAVLLLCFSAVPVLSLAPAAYAASAVVVQTGNATDSGATTFTIPLKKTVSEGDVIVVAVSFDSTSFPTVTDTMGSTYTLAVTSGTQGFGGIYYATAKKSALSDTLQVTLASGTDYASGSAYDVYGITTSGVMAAYGAGPNCIPFRVPDCIDFFGASSVLAYQSGDFLVGAVFDSNSAIYSITPTPSFNSYSYIPSGDGALNEYYLPSASGSTNFKVTAGSGYPVGVEGWGEMGAVFPPKPPTPPPTPPADIPSYAMPAVLNFTTYGGATFTGLLVRTQGRGYVIYNFPGFNETLLDHELARGNSSLVLVTMSACSTTIRGQEYVRVSGFSASLWGSPLLNSTEAMFGYYTSFTSSAQGWPTEPACGT